MHVVFLVVLTLVLGFMGPFLIAYSYDFDKRKLPFAFAMTATAIALLVWFIYSLSYPSRVLKQYNIPVSTVPMPDGSYKQVFAYQGADSGISDVYSQFHTILPGNAEIKVTEYDCGSYAGITYTGMISKKYEPYIPR